MGKEDATYWLALAADDRGNHPSAEDYLSSGSWKDPQSMAAWGFFDLAETAEAAGQIETRGHDLPVRPRGPRRLRPPAPRRWLEEKTSNRIHLTLTAGVALDYVPP